MEREGTGYDRIYETLLASGRPAPLVTEGDDRVTVSITRRIVRPEVVDFLAKADQQFSLSQRERIVLGLIAQHESLTAIELLRRLELKDADALRPWLGRLSQLDLVQTKGNTKGTQYLIAPELLRRLHFKGQTSLKGIERHRLRELVLCDLKIYLEASISEIHARVGKEIPLRRLRRAVDELRQEGLITPKGDRKWRRYLLTKIPPNKPPPVNKTGQ